MAAAAHTAIEVDKHGQERDLVVGDVFGCEGAHRPGGAKRVGQFH